LFVEEGNRPRIGQAFIVIDPGALASASVFLDRVEVLLAGLTVPDALAAALRASAASA
jgi:(2R)-3-sulfolactate dehydrogenase (NADP+)